jgi:hypothetical protein
MTFDARERTRTLGQPATLYRFVYGTDPTSFFAYTDARSPIDYGGDTYEPIPIARGPVISSGSLDRSTMEIRLPRDLGVCELFQLYPPSHVVTLIIRQGHLDDPDDQWLVVWSGRVLSSARNDSEVVLSCEPVSTSMRRNGLRRFYGYGCPHVLYGNQCKASKAAATITTAVVSVSGFTITPTGAWQGALANRVFRNGYVEWTKDGIREVRSIQSVSGGVITVKGTLRTLATSDAIDVVAGCNHKQDDCLNVHNNIRNFGGQPWIPFKNPFRNYNSFD